MKWISSKHIDERGLITAYELISKKAVEETSTRVAPARSTIIITRVSVGKFAFADDDYAINQDLTALVSKDDERFAPQFIRVAAHHIAQVVERNAEGIGVRGVTRKFLAELQIPLPPLAMQQEIVAEIEGYQKVINGARAVLDHYHPHIPIHPDWPMEVFGEVTSTITPPAKIPAGEFRQVGRFPVIDQSQNAIAGRTDDESALVDGSDGLVIFGDHTCAVKFINERFAQGADGIKIIKTGERLEPKFVYFYLLSYPIEQDGYKRHFGKLKESRIAIPPPATQRAIVAEIEAEQALVAANLELVTRMQTKIQTTLARVWGEEETASIED